MTNLCSCCLQNREEQVAAVIPPERFYEAMTDVIDLVISLLNQGENVCVTVQTFSHIDPSKNHHTAH